MDGFGKIAYGLRSTRYDPSFVVSWTQLCASGTRVGDLVLHPAIRLPHHMACNFLMVQFLESDCDSLLFVDDDHDIPIDSIEKLRGTPGNYDVVSALTVTRREPFMPIVIRLKDGKPSWVSDPDGVVAVDVVGLAFTLIKRDICEEIVAAKGTREIFRMTEVCEDGEFCKNVRENGGTLAVNCDVNIGHTVDTVLRWNAQAGKTEITFPRFGVERRRRESWQS